MAILVGNRLHCNIAAIKHFFEKEKLKLCGITWDGRNIWAAAEGVGKIFQLSLSSLKEIKF